MDNNATARGVTPGVNIRRRTRTVSINNADDGEYKVGPGKPPRQHQFKPGQSGNPRGRPKGARGFNALVRDILSEKISVNTKRGSRRMAAIELLLRRSLEIALKGDLRAVALVLSHYRAASPEPPEPVDVGVVAPLTASDEAILQDFLDRAIADLRPAKGEANA